MQSELRENQIQISHLSHLYTKEKIEKENNSIFLAHLLQSVGIFFMHFILYFLNILLFDAELIFI